MTLLKNIRPLLQSMLLLVGFMQGMQAAAAVINTTNYDIYIGNANDDGNGYSDYYFVQKPIFVLLHGDIATPLLIKGANFIVAGNASAYNAPVAFSLTDAQLAAKISSNQLRLAQLNSDIFIWDNGLADQNNILLRGATTATSAVLLSSSSNVFLPGISKTYSPANYFGISDRSVGLSISDINGDGKMDIQLASYVMDTSGALIATPYTSYKRFSPAGQLTGTISADPDGPGALVYPAVRYTYSADRGLLEKVENGKLSNFPNETIAPSTWEANGFAFTVLSSTRNEYDDTGRKIRVSAYGANSLLLSLTEYSYDTLDRLSCTAIRMDLIAKGDACTSTNLTGLNPDRISRLTYDENNYGLVAIEERAVGTSIQQTYVTNTYNGGQLASQTDANLNRTELYYDVNGRLKRVIYPSTTAKTVANGTETGLTGDYVEFTYDVNGNKTSERKRSGAKIYYTYDNNNRLVLKDMADNTKDVCYDYDARGLQIQAHFSSNFAPGTCTTAPGITNTYDGFGSVATSSTLQLGVNRTLSYTYDLNGNRESIKHPDAKVFSYAFNFANKVTGVADSATPNNNLLTVTYQDNGRRFSLARNGGTAGTTYYNFNNNVQLSSFQQNFSNNTNNLTNSFSYNNVGQIATLVKSNTLYYYQGSDDRLGAYAPDGLNRYATIAGQPMGYDLNSNMTNDGTSVYTYDDENRWLTGSTGAASFVYDPNGRLFQTTINGSATQYVYDGDALVAEYNASGTLLRRYVHGDQVDEPWVQYNGSGTLSSDRRYLRADHQGSIIAHNDSTGNVLATLAYDTYGIPMAKNNAVAGAFGYTGQIWFKELGLNHYKARIYSPKIGRFLQTDPIGYKDDYDLYTYVGNDPVNKTDPTGMIAGVDDAVEVAGVALAYTALTIGALTVCEMSCGKAITAIDNFVKGIFAESAETPPAPEPNTSDSDDGKSRNKPPAALPEAEGRPHSIPEKPGEDGQYTTHNGDGTSKQYRGKGQDHGPIPRPNVKETKINTTPNGKTFIDKGRVRPPRPDEIPKKREPR